MLIKSRVKAELVHHFDFPVIIKAGQCLTISVDGKNLEHIIYNQDTVIGGLVGPVQKKVTVRR